MMLSVSSSAHRRRSGSIEWSRQTLLQFGMSSCRARIFSLIRSRLLCNARTHAARSVSEMARHASAHALASRGAARTLSDRLCTSAGRLRLALRAADLLVAPGSSSRSCRAERRASKSGRIQGRAARFDRINGCTAVATVVGHAIATSSGLTEQSAGRWLLLLSWLRSPLPEQTEEVVTAAASGGLVSGCGRG